MEQINITGSEIVRPKPEILDALKRDYPLEASVADLVDNSIDAKAKKILIRINLQKEAIKSLEVIDDGFGITKNKISFAMQFAYKRKYKKKDLGMYGVGLKVASLSHANILSVFSKSKKNGEVGRQWTTNGILNSDWKLNIIDQNTVKRFLEKKYEGLSVSQHGTIVRWDDIEDFKRIQTGWEEFIQKIKHKICLHLGLKMHRLIQGKQIRIMIQLYDEEKMEGGPVEVIEALSPFPIGQFGEPGYPKKYLAKIGSSSINLIAHVWKKKSKEQGYRLGGGKVAEHQGFYFFRNGRLITEGGWCGMLGNSEPHLSLARVEVDIPESANRIIKVQHNKARVDLSAAAVSAFYKAKSNDGEYFSEYIKKAEEIYRLRKKPKSKTLLFNPGNGFGNCISKAVKNTGRYIYGQKVSLELKKNQLNRSVIKYNTKKKEITFEADKCLDLANSAVKRLVQSLCFFALSKDLSKGTQTNEVLAKIKILNDVL